MRKPPVKIDVSPGVADVPFDSALERAVALAPTWLAGARRAALANFRRLGVPTMRHEEWRSTNLTELMKIAFEPASRHAEGISADQLAGLRFHEIDGPVMVFVNGRFAAELSSIEKLPAGVVVLPLEVAMQEHEAEIRPHFERDGAAQSEAFSSLNAALTEGGAFVHIAKNAQVDQPIIILSIDVPGSAPVMTNPRNVIVAKHGCKAKIIERYVSIGAVATFTNAVTDVVVGEQAHIEHYFIEQQSLEAFNISALRSRQERSSNFHSHTMLLGGKLVRNNVHPILDGEPCECLINGLFVGSGSQHMDNHMRVEHAQPRGDSRQFYKGILADKAAGVFSGRIIVHPGAQKTDAKQSNQNLLLSDTAMITTKPQLEIYADDVKCTHGATIGQLDENALFYLRSRGLTEADARNMLIFAFAGESLERMELEPMRHVLKRLLFERLPHGELLEHAHA
jgi:Fe-S cluster assembly protein SufD